MGNVHRGLCLFRMLFLGAVLAVAWVALWSGEASAAERLVPSGEGPARPLADLIGGVPPAETVWSEAMEKARAVEGWATPADSVANVAPAAPVREGTMRPQQGDPRSQDGGGRPGEHAVGAHEPGAKAATKPLITRAPKALGSVAQATAPKAPVQALDVGQDGVGEVAPLRLLLSDSIGAATGLARPTTEDLYRTTSLVQGDSLQPLRSVTRLLRGLEVGAQAVLPVRNGPSVRLAAASSGGLPVVSASRMSLDRNGSTGLGAITAAGAWTAYWTSVLAPNPPPDGGVPDRGRNPTQPPVGNLPFGPAVPSLPVPISGSAQASDAACLTVWLAQHWQLVSAPEGEDWQLPAAAPDRPRCRPD
jgi:hypothetical protein